MALHRSFTGLFCFPKFSGHASHIWLSLFPSTWFNYQWILTDFWKAYFTCRTVLVLFQREELFTLAKLTWASPSFLNILAAPSPKKTFVLTWIGVFSQYFSPQADTESLKYAVEILERVEALKSIKSELGSWVWFLLTMGLWDSFALWALVYL